MLDALKSLLKQPYWVIALILGVFLVAFPYVTLKDHELSSHQAITLVPVIIGCVLLLVSVIAFGFGLFSRHTMDVSGLDFSRVRDEQGILSTIVGNCEIRVAEGRIEEYPRSPGVAVVLPSNEYFDDDCAHDPRSALGAYLRGVFGDRIDLFVALAKLEAGKKFGEGTIRQKTVKETGRSFGSGKCLLLPTPLGSTEPVALISTTTQRAEEGNAAQISCLFEGVHELTKCLADARINQAVMPVLGGGHGGLQPPLAFIGLLLAVVEAANYGQGSQRLKRVTIIVFRKDPATRPEVDRGAVRRALALIGAQT